MAFWTTTPERDPKRNFRFQVFITGVQGTEPAVWWAKKVAKPNFTVAESKHVYLGHTFYYPGKVEWQTIAMTLVDPLDPGSLYRFNQAVRSAGYRIPGNANVLTTQSKKKAHHWALLRFFKLMVTEMKLKLGLSRILSLRRFLSQNLIMKMMIFPQSISNFVMIGRNV